MVYVIQFCWQLASRIRMVRLEPACKLSANLYVLLCVQWKPPDDGQRNFSKHVEFYSKNKFEESVHLVGFTKRIHSLVLSLEGRAWQEPEPSRDRYSSGTLHPGQVLRGSLPLLSPAFRRSHFSRQVPPCATTREILAAKSGTVGEKDVR